MTWFSFLIFIKIYLIYSVPSVSTVQQSDPATHTPPPCFIFHDLIFFFCFLFFCFLGPHLWHVEVPRLGSNQSCSHWPIPQPQQHQIRAASMTYTTAHGDAGSLTHWVRSGIEPETSWFLVRLLDCFCCATLGTPDFLYDYYWGYLGWGWSGVGENSD